MLNKAERYRLAPVLKICSIIGQYPIEVGLTRVQLEKPSLKKRCVCYLSFGLFVLQVLYKIGSLVYALFFDPDLQHHQLVIHAILVMAAVMCVLWYILLYISDPALFAKYFNITVQGNVGVPLDPDDELKKDWKTRIWEYSMQDLIASNIPYMVGVGALLIIVTYIYDPTMSVLMFYAMPSRLQNWATFGLLLLEEARFIIMLMSSIVVPIWQLQVTSYDLVTNQFQILIRRIQNGTLNSRKVYKTLRSLQLYVSMANNVNRYLIFTWKLLSISICILFGYSAVAHFQDHPVFGTMYYFILFDTIFIYTVIYEKAFKIPQLFRESCAYALLHMRGNRRDAFRREIRSIPSTGIQVGDFHKMERASTLIFMDFIVKNIVSMLVAYG